MTGATRAPRVMLAVALTVFGAQCVGRDGAGRSNRDADDLTSYSVRRLALDTLFNGIEHAQQLVIWATDAADGPALEALGSTRVRPGVSRAIDLVQLATSLPARVMSESELADLFRRNADGWAAFFRAHPGTPGLVELSAVRLVERESVAETYVGRSCGEHCRTVWRITARRQARDDWRVEQLQWVRVPGV